MCACIHVDQETRSESGPSTSPVANEVSVSTMGSARPKIISILAMALHAFVIVAKRALNIQRTEPFTLCRVEARTRGRQVIGNREFCASEQHGSKQDGEVAG